MPKLRVSEATDQSALGSCCFSGFFKIYLKDFCLTVNHWNPPNKTQQDVSWPVILPEKRWAWGSRSCKQIRTEFPEDMGADGEWNNGRYFSSYQRPAAVPPTSHLSCLPGSLLHGNHPSGARCPSPLGPWALRPVHSCHGELLFFSLLL